MELFTITCVTCQSRLKVREAAAIGRIIGCPKCHSMVLVQPPPGWVMPAAAATEPLLSETPGTSSGAETPTLPLVQKDQPTVVVAPAAPTTSPAPATASPAPATAAGPVPAPVSPPPAVNTEVRAEPLSAEPAIAHDSAPVAAASVENAASLDTAAAPALPKTRTGREFGWRIAAGCAVLGAILMTGAFVFRGDDTATRADNGPPTVDDSPATHADRPLEVRGDDAGVKAPAPDPTDATRAEPPARSDEAEVSSDEPAVEHDQDPGPAVDPVDTVQEVDSTTEGNAGEALIPDEAVPPDPAPRDDTAAPPEAIAGGSADDGAASDSPDDDPMSDVGPLAAERLIVRTRDDVEARLEDRWTRVVIQEQPLSAVCALAGQLSGLHISLDAEALAEAGVQLSSPISLELDQVSTHELLLAADKQGRLRVQVIGDQVQLTAGPTEDEPWPTVRHSLARVAASGAEREQISAWIESLILPPSWDTAGGDASWNIEGDELVVTQSPAGQRLVARFLDRLRVARGADHEQGRTDVGFTLDARAWEKVVSVHLGEEATMAKWAAALSRAGKVTVLVDGPGLRAAGLGPEMEMPQAIRGKPLREMLFELIQPRAGERLPQLALRLLDKQIVEITSRERADALAEVVWYPLNRDEAAPDVAAHLSEELQRRLGRESLVLVDEKSGALMVRGRMSLQRQAVTALAEMRTSAAAAP